MSGQRWNGNGPPALLLHGIGSSAASWDSLIPGLAQLVSPIAIDLRGHGDSGKPDSGYLYDDYLADIDAVIADQVLERPHLIGHSLGGILALWWAARHPDTAASLVIIDSPLRSGEVFRPPFDQWIAMNAMTPQGLAATYRSQHPEWTAEQALRRARVMTSVAPGVFQELKADSLAHDGVDRLAEIEGIRSPILFLHGDPDAGSQVHPNDIARIATWPNVTVRRFPGAGHGLHRDHPEAFLAVIRTWGADLTSHEAVK